MKYRGLKVGISSVASAALATVLMPAPAHASDWGCQVALCLANPGGPTQYASCVPPITKLWQALASGSPMPDCIEGGIKKLVVKKVHGVQMVTETLANGTKTTIALGSNPPPPPAPVYPMGQGGFR